MGFQNGHEFSTMVLAIQELVLKSTWVILVMPVCHCQILS
jgi:hypothetical protein